MTIDDKIYSATLTIEDVRDCFRNKEYKRAEVLCGELLKKDVKNAEVLYCLGAIKQKLGLKSEGITCVSGAIHLAENKIGNWYIELGNIYCNDDKFDEALVQYHKALAVAPKLTASLYNNIGIVYKKKNELDKAVEYYDKAMAIAPENVAAYSNLALVLKEKGEYNKAVELYEKAISIKPDFACAYYNWGLTLKDQNRPLEAIPLIEKCLEIDPDFTDAFMDLAICLLVTKNFEKGWKVYERRYAGLQEPRPGGNKPKWNGESLEGKRIYVFHEQGCGDTIQFARYISLLNELGAKVLFKPQTGLEKLFKQSDLKAEILDKYLPETDYDFYSLLLSLPYQSNANAENIPSPKGYLKADDAKVREYKEKYFNTDKFKVGIFWQGSSTFKNDKNRSTKLENFYPLGKLENVQLYSIQKGFGEEQLDEIPENFNIIKLGQEFNDFADTAAAIENLDLVITVDSSISHLTGALGKPVWILLSYIWEWRWFACDDKTPWYESMKIFHQQKRGDWDDVFIRVENELKKLSKS